MSKRIVATSIFIFVLLSSSMYGVSHKILVSAGFLIRNSYISQISTLSTNGNWYAVNIDNWNVYDVPLGISVHVAYEAVFKNNFFLRLDSGIETTKNSVLPIDIGGGIKLNIKNGVKLSIGVYFATVQMVGKMGIVPTSVGPIGKDPPKEISYYMGMFGFRARISLEVPVSKKVTFGPYISYAAYPHAAHNIISDLDTDIYVNNVVQGLRLDGFQIGLELGVLL